MSALTCDDTAVANEIKKEYDFYQKEVKPVVDLVELLYDAIPKGLLNEVRSFTGHICDASIRNDISVEKRLANVNNAHSHLRRIILDCYKLMCLWYREEIRIFDKKYRWSDLADVRDGEFVPEYSHLKKEAKNAFLDAKKAERPGNNDRDKADDLGKVYHKYLSAYNAYVAVYDYLDKCDSAVRRAAHKDTRRKVVAVLGWIVGIVATVICTFITLEC